MSNCGKYPNEGPIINDATPLVLELKRQNGVLRSELKECAINILDQLGFAQELAEANSKIAELERENVALRKEVEQLKGALALGQQNCDDAYNDLREERDEAKAENAALRELSARMADEMREIDHEFASLRDYEQASKEVKP